MKFVLLEILIVAVATRSVLSLIGKAPAWHNPLWECFALVAAAATAAMIVEEGRKRVKHEAPPPAKQPHIPLDRIAPFTHEAMLVRFGARSTRDIHLN
jgi:hypothetical protein